MIVGIDGRSLAGVQARRGVAHYTASLAGALASGFPEDSWRLLVLGDRLDAPPPGVEAVARRVPRRLAFGAAALTGRPRLDRLVGGGLDVAWIPAPAPLALSRDVPLVLTLHDLSFAERPEDYTAYERAWHRVGRLGELARRADRVMAVSQTTREAAIARWDLDPARVAVGGDSAGGNLAAVVALMARDRRQPAICLQVLLYPIIEYNFTTPSYSSFADGYLLTRSAMQWFWQQYVSREADAKQVYAAPLPAKDFRGLAPALIVTAEFDVLCDEGEAYAEILMAAGVPTEHTRYNGMIHGFIPRLKLFDSARTAVAQIATALKRRH